MREAHGGAGVDEGHEDGSDRSGARGWRRRAGGLGLRLGVVVGVLAVAGGGVVTLDQLTAAELSPTTTDIPALSVEPAETEPGVETPGSAALAGSPLDDDAEQDAGEPDGEAAEIDERLGDWAERVASATGVPARALIAYGNAELSTAESHPDCGLSWATLAGVGRVESNHGQFGDAELQDNGVPSEPIIGVPLDGGEDVQLIPDTDGGKWDGDPVHDRAVGPMQFIPSTWESFAVDGNGSGESHPQQIDDAALAAAHYLCTDGRDMAGAQGWWQGILSYNHSVDYAQRVFGVADDYAQSAEAEN